MHKRVFYQQQRSRPFLLSVTLLTVHASVLQGVRTSTAAATATAAPINAAAPVIHAQRTGPTLLDPWVSQRQRHEPLDGVG